MTRKELLMARANDVVEEVLSKDVCISESECQIMREVVLDELLRVEREVWGEVAEHLMYGSHLSLASMLSALQPTDVLLAHDGEQRQIIDEQVEENRGLRSDVKLMQQANAEQRQQIEELEKGLGCSRSHPHEEMNRVCELKTDIARLKNEMSHWTWVRFKQLEEENARLREALQLLHDNQNGCPLPSYEQDWNRAMELTEQILKGHP